MAALAIVTSSPPGMEGGHLVIARALVSAARQGGHDAHLVITPECTFGRQVSSYLETWRTDVGVVEGRAIDQVVSLRFPSYAVRHPAHVCWLNHTMREYYDLWPQFAGALSPRGRMKERVKRIVIRAVDRWLLTRNVTRVVAQSKTIQRRLRSAFGIDADVVLPPPPQRRYRCDDYGDYVFAVSRLTPLKRLHLLVRALAEPLARHIRAVIAGEGECRADLERLAASLGVDRRVTFRGHLDDEELVRHLAACRAVCFPPFAEDYGFVTIEAFASRKPVVTCRDSGGPTELVRDNETGLIAEPTSSSIAAALARLVDDRSLAERLGGAAAALAETMTWDAAVKRLLIV